MPVAEFAGSFGWGYDGVQWFAPFHGYGTPADLQHFVDTAHGLGLAVILDVVYNHLGPSGNYLPKFSRWYTSRRYANEWGEALNFDDAHCEGMRELVLSNVAYWVREFHVDGFRIDAAQQIYDVSPEHVLAALTRVARETAAPRSVIVVAEHEPQHARLMRPVAHGGYGLDGALQRRPAPFDARGADRHARSLHVRLPRHRPRVAVGGAVRVPVPGPVLSLAVAAPRRARPRSAAARVHRLPREPRPGRQRRGRQTAGRDHQPAGVAGDVGAAAARAVDAAALPGPGVGLADSRSATSATTRPICRPRCSRAARRSSASSRACARPTRAPRSTPSDGRPSRRAGSTTTSIRRPIRSGGCIGI